MAAFAHTPVLLAETIALLGVSPGGCYCDATLGGGGHARGILERSAPNGRLLGVDRDPEAIAHCRDALAEFGDRVTLRQGNFSQIDEIMEEVGWGPVNGVVVDLGVSSHQLETAERGVGLSVEGPLDMRMGPDAEQTAAALIAEVTEQQLARVIYEYGEEHQSRPIARAIKRAHQSGRLNSTADLRDAVWRAKGGASRRRRRIHPATKTFQALRIAVNDELGCLRLFLDSVLDVLCPGGAVAVISFHSLEDRLVKRHFAALAGRPVAGAATESPATAPVVKLLTRRPTRASAEEVQGNPRARSAKLRVVEKLA